MFKTITDIKEYLENPILEMSEESIKKAKTDVINLFGKKYTMYADEWKHHVHIKCTDFCDADCAFCIERSERNNPQNKENVLESAKELLQQLHEQGHLKTVSITGGEPTIFPLIAPLCDLINSYNTKLFSINTNGRFLDRIPNDFNGWVNISKHSTHDADVFKRDFEVTPEMVDLFKKSHKSAKVRFQCVLGVTKSMASLGDVIGFIKTYKDCVDDFSFRNLIINDEEDSIMPLMTELRKLLFTEAKFIEQTIQDYYVYETYEMFGTNITISWSNMKALREYNETHEQSNFLEEIIVHPDGTISGSWNKKTLIIREPSSKKFTFIPCKGIGCKNHCPRYVAPQAKVVSVFGDSGICSCYSQDSCYGNRNVDSCSSYISSCY